MCIALIVKFHRASTLCLAAYTPSPNQLPTCKINLFFVDRNKYKEACDLLKAAR